MIKNLSLLLAAAFCFTTLSNAFAQPGNLDTDFDTDGIVQTHLSGYNQAGANSVVIQNDGKIVVAGVAGNGVTYHGFLARYNEDGSLDNTFGTNGIVLGSSYGTRNWFNALALQDNGKIVAVGLIKSGNYNQFLISRYKSDGSFDTNFGNNGWTTLDFGTANDVANALGIQSDGKIVVGGETQSSSVYKFLVARYDTTGNLDNTFSSDGMDTLSFAGPDNRCKTLVIQPNGKIIAAGNGHNGTDTDLGFVRYNTDGTLDASFGNGGKALFGYSISETVRSATLQSDGKILACGYVVPGGAYVLRLNADGTLDTGFGTNGITISNDLNSSAAAISLQTDGMILTAGVSFSNGGGTESDMALRRYQSNGQPDSTFGTNGLVYTDVNNGEYDEARGMALQPDLKIVVSGTGAFPSSSNTDLLVARYLPGITVGVIDQVNCISEQLVYPNPVRESQLKLKYDLLKNENLTLQLFDMQGRLMKTYLDDEKRMAGKHEEQLPLPASMRAGTYFLKINAGASQVSILIEKL